MMTLLQTVRMGQNLELLDVKNPAPGPNVSGTQAILNLILTGRDYLPVQEMVS